MNMRHLVLWSILSGTILMMVGCGQKGALFLPNEEAPSQPEEQSKP